VAPLRIVYLDWAKEVARVGRWLLHCIEIAPRLNHPFGCSTTDRHRFERQMPGRTDVEGFGGSLYRLVGVARKKVSAGQQIKPSKIMRIA
jgi:hypothetical protein